MIDEVIGYWNDLSKEQSREVYVGKWGDKTRGGHRKYWTDITKKRKKKRLI